MIIEPLPLYSCQIALRNEAELALKNRHIYFNVIFSELLYPQITLFNEAFL